VKKILRGYAWKYEDDINTDYIFPTKYWGAGMTDPYEFGKVAMDGIDPNFSKKVKKGDFVVAGKNFGCGSSREGAAIAMKYSGGGLSAIVAESFARIFYRNCINIGFPIFTAQNVTKYIDDGDLIELNLEKIVLKNETKGTLIDVEPISEQSLKILEYGGLINYMRRLGYIK